VAEVVEAAKCKSQGKSRSRDTTQDVERRNGTKENKKMTKKKKKMSKSRKRKNKKQTKKNKTETI